MPKLSITTALAALVVALFVSMVVLLMSQAGDLQRLTDAYREHHAKYVIANRMRQSTNDLTRLARTYAVTGDAKFETQYLKILETRNGRLPEPENYDWIYWDYLAVDGKLPPFKLTESISYDEVIRRGGLNPEEQQLLMKARKRSDELAEFEKSVFKQLTHPSTTPPVALLFDENYHTGKLEILSNVNTVFKNIADRARQSLFRAEATYETKQTMQYGLFAALLISGLGWVYANHRANATAIVTLDAKVSERTANLAMTNEKLRQALKEIETLEGLLPICSYCHNIRNDDGSWTRIEDYISSRSMARFTHGMCPGCLDREKQKLKQNTGAA